MYQQVYVGILLTATGCHVCPIPGGGATMAPVPFEERTALASLPLLAMSPVSPDRKTGHWAQRLVAAWKYFQNMPFVQSSHSMSFMVLLMEVLQQRLLTNPLPVHPNHPQSTFLQAAVVHNLLLLP